MSTKDLSYYLSLKYPAELHERPDGHFFAIHPDLDGCMAEGASLEEAFTNLADSRELWIEARLENGYSVPEPRVTANDSEYSGRISLRMAPSLHEQLAASAERKGISLNLHINTILALYAGGEDILGEVRAEIRAVLNEATTTSRDVTTRPTKPTSNPLMQPTANRSNLLSWPKTKALEV